MSLLMTQTKTHMPRQRASGDSAPDTPARIAASARPRRAAPFGSNGSSVACSSSAMRGGATAAAWRGAWQPRRHVGSGEQRAVAAATSYKENPQNVPECEAVPTPELTALQAVEAQLKAIQMNDEPWVNHGIHLMYEFCYDAGSMERSRFFGFSKDLYHVDHFMGAIANFCPELINCRSYAIGPEAQLPGGGAGFRVAVVGQKGDAAAFDFELQRQEFGLRQGSWQTKSLLRVEGE